MIGWDDIYKVVAAMVPLYVALVLGYGSVKWWHMFTPDQTDAINRLCCYFIFPLFTFEFTSHVDPFRMNYPFIAADVISKSFILLALALWANCCKNGSYSWSITSFSLSSLNNTLVVGVPLMKAMYGDIGGDLVVQSFVVQSIVWFQMLLFMLEFRRTKLDLFEDHSSDTLSGKDLEGNSEVVLRIKPSLSLVMKIVGLKLSKNPNVYGCVLGVVWAFLSNRWSFQMPTFMEGSILIMSKAGAGIGMFCMGLFMAAQEKIIACGVGLTVYGMILRFIVGPATMAIGSIALGLRGDILRVAIIQGALPQSITSFVFAKEYGLHANVLSTAVIFGTIASLPLLVAFYAMLEFLH